jgi:hypothetical protein
VRDAARAGNSEASLTRQVGRGGRVAVTGVRCVASSCARSGCCPGHDRGGRRRRLPCAVRRPRTCVIHVRDANAPRGTALVHRWHILALPHPGSCTNAFIIVDADYDVRLRRADRDLCAGVPEDDLTVGLPKEQKVRSPRPR